jgi:predicted XRE-type DNA-binding protein
MPTLSEERLAKFWSSIDQSGGPDACWPWKGRVDRDGYGYLPCGQNARNVRSIRLAVFLATGKDPYGYIILHSCDNPPCCNPKHLTPGTDLQNNAFRWKNPSVTGSRNNNAKLTEKQVEQIRKRIERGERQLAIAPLYGVSQALISKIARGEYWRRFDTRAAIPQSFIAGERHPMAKVTEDIVRKIRALEGTASQYAIARQFSVSQSSVSLILKRRIWRNVA